MVQQSKEDGRGADSENGARPKNGLVVDILT
jgi:hypothetical protein